MTKDELHRYIEDSNGSESNICQIYVIKDGEMALDMALDGTRFWVVL